MTRDFIVVKLGGEVVASESMAVVAADIAEMHRRGARLVVVHGGGPQTTALQKKLGQTPRIVAGRRVTDAETLEAVKMAVAGQVNVDACAALIAAGASPVGLHGASALAVRAEKRGPRVVSGAGSEPIDLGHVGDVTGINDALFELLANAGYIPVVSSLGADGSGRCFNINADVVANRVAVELGAKSLVVISDVSGVLRDLANPASRIARMDVAEGRKAIADGTATKGMIPKLEESFAAIAGGVRTVHIVGRLGPGELMREVTDPGSVGTALVA